MVAVVREVVIMSETAPWGTLRGKDGRRRRGWGWHDTEGGQQSGEGRRNGFSRASALSRRSSIRAPYRAQEPARGLHDLRGPVDERARLLLHPVKRHSLCARWMS